jgi:hypothetical protein
MKQVEYVKCENFNFLTLNGLYNGDYDSLKNLDLNILRIIEMESPISLNMLKARLREAMEIKKISQKALDIINERLDYYGIVRTNNYYEEILWPKTGEFKIDYVRKNSELQIYDVAYQEMVNLAKDLNKNGLSGEELYRAILAFYNYEVLTEKALNFLKFIEEKIL